MQIKDFIELGILAFQKEALKKIIFSRGKSGEVSKISCRLCAHRGNRFLAMEYSLPGNTVSQKNITEENLENELTPLFKIFGQVNLITALGDAEWKINKRGSEVVLGGDTLFRKLSGDTPIFESAIEELDRKKNYILKGNEPFLIKLGISSSDGRVHDKKQGKFRQINRFLEHIDDLYKELPSDGLINIFDLCCGKSYLSFALYYYLTEEKGRRVSMWGVDLKSGVIDWCRGLASELGYTGMRFSSEDIKSIRCESVPDMVVSLHACDVATDIVIDTAIRLGAKVILSTPCCHNYLKSRINSENLSFVSDYPHLRAKLCEVITDAIRISRLRAHGYSVTAPELTDPENTPKNTLIRAVKRKRFTENEKSLLEEEYEKILDFVLGEKKDMYLKDL